jgi:hypothetical protein
MVWRLHLLADASLLGDVTFTELDGKTAISASVVSCVGIRGQNELEGCWLRRRAAQQIQSTPRRDKAPRVAESRPSSDVANPPDDQQSSQPFVLRFDFMCAKAGWESMPPLGLLMSPVLWVPFPLLWLRAN